MARPQRDAAAGVFHVFTHCVWAAGALFVDDIDRTTHLRELARATVRFDWTCVAFCLLQTHYHLLLEVETGALSAGMQQLNWRYAMQFNQRHRLRGHVLFDRFGARRIVADSDLLSTYRYIVMNPVEAGVCAAPHHWPWSSYAGTVDLPEPQTFVNPQLVLGCFAGPPELSRAKLRAFVEKS